jgi:hypothetical protein
VTPDTRLCVFPTFNSLRSTPALLQTSMSTLHPLRPSRSSSSSRRSRGPLQELPLDQFLLPPNTPSQLGSNTKRPVSPGTPALCSPAKRRILNEEGLFAMKSPLSAPVSAVSATASSSKQPINTPQQYQQNITRFVDALTGPDSPARKLDFGTPKNAVAGSRTPSRRSEEEKTQRLAPSPEIKARSHSRLRDLEAEEGYFSTPPPQTQTQSQSQTVPLSPSSSLAGPSSYPEFLTVPRELPPPIDPQSEHYPGFPVYQDPHFLLPTPRLASPALLPTPTSILTPLDNSIDIDYHMESLDMRELVKENLPPRRKARKATTVPVRRLSIFGAGVGSGLGKARATPSKEGRHAMRKILEDEVNGDQGDD